MLKMTTLVGNLTSHKLEVGDGKSGFDVCSDSIKHAKKSRKLSKTLKLFKSGNSKNKKLFKSQKLAKSRKKLLKSENSLNFDAKKTRLSFLISGTSKAFNY